MSIKRNGNIVYYVMQHNGNNMQYGYHGSDVNPEPYSVYLKSGIFQTSGDFESYYSDLQVYEGQAVDWEFASNTGGTGRIIATGLDTKRCGRVKISTSYYPFEINMIGATDAYYDGTYWYGTVSGDTVDIGFEVTIPSENVDELLSIEILEVSFYTDNVLLWTGSNTVTYVVDTSLSYTEEVDSGQSCLNPTSFTPSKEGWEFVGWSQYSPQDPSDSYILTNMIMKGQPITLYAVFRTSWSATFYSGENQSTSEVVTDYQYYINGNSSYMWMTSPTEYSEIDGYTFYSWTTTKWWDVNKSYEPGAPILINSDGQEFYGVYRKPITIYYDGNGADSGDVASESSYCTLNTTGNKLGIKFTLPENNYVKDGYNFTGWMFNGTVYEPGTQLEAIYDDTTVYAVWKSDIDAQPFYWVQNSVAAKDQTLVVTQTGATATDKNVSGSSLNIPNIDGNDDQQYGINPTVHCETNSVNVNGNNKMEIKIAHVFGNTCRIWVDDNLICGPFEGDAYDLTYVVDVTPGSDVKLVFEVGNWALSHSGNMTITSIRFYYEDATTSPTYAVTYIVDENLSYEEHVTQGTSCLNPTSFTPSKEGWEFVGWSDSETADGNILSNKIMGDEELTLYASYVQESSATFCSGEDGTHVENVTGARYFNGSGSEEPASYRAPNGAQINGWTWRGWAAGGETSANADVAYLTGQYVTDQTTYYGLYEKSITLSYDGNDADSGSVDPQSDTAYYNSAGNSYYPTFTLAQNRFIKSGHTFKAWTIDGVTELAEGHTISIYDNEVVGAVWSTIPVEPFYLHVDTLGLSGSFTEVENGSAMIGHLPTSSEGWWTVRVSHNGGVAYSYAIQEITNVQRKQCNRVKFTVGHYETPASINIGGVVYNITGWGEHIVDISSVTADVISVSLNTGAAPNEHGIQITAPYFYREEVVAEPYTIKPTQGLFTTEGAFESEYSDLYYYDGEAVTWEFYCSGVGTGTIIAKGLETKGCNRVKIKWYGCSLGSTATLIGATNVTQDSSYFYGTVTGTVVDVGLSITTPAGLDMPDSVIIEEISFYAE